MAWLGELPPRDEEEDEPADPFEDLEDRIWKLMEPEKGRGFEARVEAWAAGR